MKKLFSFVTVMLCAVMLSTTAFAANATDAISIYRNYLKNQANITSVDMSMTQRISMNDGTDSVDVMKQNIAAKVIMSDDKLEMEMRIVDPSSGEISNAYFKNNYLYQQVGDEKYKIKMDMDQALASTSGVDLNLTEDIIKEAKMEFVEDGIKVTYKTNINNLKDAQGNSLASMLDDLDLPDDMQMKLSNITTTVIIGNDGVLKSGSNVVGMKISSEGVTIEFKVVQTFKVNSINSVENIKFPSDLSSYQLLTM